MKDIQNLIDERSQLISKAEALKGLGRIKESEKTYQLASQKEKQIALRFFSLSKVHWISAISCLYHTKAYSEAYDLINEFLSHMDPLKLNTEQYGVLQDLKNNIVEMIQKEKKERELNK